MANPITNWKNTEPTVNTRVLMSARMVVLDLSMAE